MVNTIVTGQRKNLLSYLDISTCDISTGVTPIRPQDAPPIRMMSGNDGSRYDGSSCGWCCRRRSREEFRVRWMNGWSMRLRPIMARLGPVLMGNYPSPDHRWVKSTTAPVPTITMTTANTGHHAGRDRRRRLALLGRDVSTIIIHPRMTRGPGHWGGGRFHHCCAPDTARRIQTLRRRRPQYDLNAVFRPPA